MEPARYSFLKEFRTQDLYGAVLVFGHDAQGLVQIGIEFAAKVLTTNAHLGGLLTARHRVASAVAWIVAEKVGKILNSVDARIGNPPLRQLGKP